VNDGSSSGVSAARLEPERSSRTRPRHAEVPSKSIRFTAPDGRQLSKALDIISCLDDVPMNDLLQDIVREAIQKHPRCRVLLDGN
jgi:hypothetical protein